MAHCSADDDGNGGWPFHLKIDKLMFVDDGRLRWPNFVLKLIVNDNDKMFA
jgi:hypothetical protein